MPEEVLDWKTYLYNKKALILYGPSETGKPEFYKSLFKSMNFKTLLVRDMDALGNIQIGENLALLFDDISLTSKTREEKIHCFDLRNSSQLRVLYGIADIPAGTPRAFPTNAIDLDTIPEKIIRRITTVNIHKSLRRQIKLSILYPLFAKFRQLAYLLHT